jgi:hypothetical protein
MASAAHGTLEIATSSAQPQRSLSASMDCGRIYSNQLQELGDWPDRHIAIWLANRIEGCKVYTDTLI